MNTFVIHAIEWAITAVLAGAAGWAAATLRRRRTHDDAMEQGMRAILRKQIVDAYDIYHVQHRRLTVERKREIDEMFEAYSALGGNGTVADMYHEIDDDIWIERRPR